MGNHCSQLTMDERNSIHRGWNEGLSCRAISQRLNRPTSCVTREVARNKVGVSYDAGRAAVSSHARRRGPVELRAGSTLWSRVRALMTLGWSPRAGCGQTTQDEPMRLTPEGELYAGTESALVMRRARLSCQARDAQGAERFDQAQLHWYPARQGGLRCMAAGERARAQCLGRVREDAR